MALEAHDDVAVLAHRELLQQALENLTTNARKHAANGTLALRVAPGPDDRVRIDVADDGPGMSAVAADRAPDRFYRAPGASDWEVWELERAMDRVAELVKKTRDETFIEKLENGKLVNSTTSIFSLGGATLDNEWNHIQQKLLRGLGVVPIENQARI